MTFDDDNDESGGDGDWLRVEMLTAEPERDSDRLTSIRALGVEVRDADTFVEDLDEYTAPAGKARLIAYFDADRSTAELRRQLDNRLETAELLSISEYRDRSWETSWMDYFEPVELSSRVRVGPPWDAPEASDDELALVIEPGMAFGTGSHETTRLCAQRLDELMRQKQPRTVLDVGCGSAILSMMASGLGARRVVGIDVKDKAIEAARKNIEKNGFSTAQIELSTTPLSSIDETFDVVVANILATILLELRDELLDATATNGDLLLSGITNEQSDDVIDAFAHRDFAVCATDTEGDWTALHLHRTPNKP